MALDSRQSVNERLLPLEEELHEGDGPIPSWLWVVVAGVAAFATLLAPFQLVWPL